MAQEKILSARQKVRTLRAARDSIIAVMPPVCDCSPCLGLPETSDTTNMQAIGAISRMVDALLLPEIEELHRQLQQGLICADEYIVALSNLL